MFSHEPSSPFKRRPWRDGFRINAFSFREWAVRRAYVHLVPDGAGTRLVGEVRPSRLAYAGSLASQVVTLLVLAGALLVSPADAAVPAAGAAAVQVFSRLGALDVDLLLDLLEEVAS